MKCRPQHDSAALCRFDAGGGILVPGTAQQAPIGDEAVAIDPGTCNDSL